MILVKSFWEITALIAAQTLASMILFATSIAILVFFLRPYMRKYKPADMAVFDRLSNISNPRNNRVMLFITALGNHKVLIPANLAMIFYFLFTGKQTWFSIRVGVIALSSLGLMFLLKYLFRRKRPLAPLLKAVKGLSFPSGHAIMSLTFYGLLAYICWHTVDIDWIRYGLVVLLAVLIFLIGFSRVYLRVHYASDVLAGFIIGLLWLFISLAILGKIEEAVQTIVES